MGWKVRRFLLVNLEDKWPGFYAFLDVVLMYLTLGLAEAVFVGLSKM